MTIQEFKTSAIKKIKNVSLSPALDINVMLEHLLNWDKGYLLAHSNEELSAENLEWLENAVEKRMTGLPVAYITGVKNFYGFDFNVTPDVLIPKPDTEILVEQAINILQKNNRDGVYSAENPVKICDMCTGSGCIGITVLALSDFLPKKPDVTLVDISIDALEVAKSNIIQILKTKTFMDNIKCIQSNLFANIPENEKFDLILTNPPYIPSAMVDELLKDGRSEPRLALDGDVTLKGAASNSTDGLEIIRNLLPQAKNQLAKNGTILMEVGEYNALEAEKLGQNLGFKTQIHKDLEGQLRLIEFSS